jgi:hypothetical protein
MTKKPALMDASKVPLVDKEAFVSGRGTKPRSATEKDLRPLNTRLPRDLIKRLKMYCVRHDTSIQDIVTRAIETQLQESNSPSEKGRAR